MGPRTIPTPMSKPVATRGDDLFPSMLVFVPANTANQETGG